MTRYSILNKVSPVVECCLDRYPPWPSSRQGQSPGGWLPDQGGEEATSHLAAHQTRSAQPWSPNRAAPLRIPNPQGPRPTSRTFPHLFANGLGAVASATCGGVTSEGCHSKKGKRASPLLGPLPRRGWSGCIRWPAVLTLLVCGEAGRGPCLGSALEFLLPQTSALSKAALALSQRPGGLPRFSRAAIPC